MLKQTLISAAVLVFALGASDVEAARAGGGRAPGVTGSTPAKTTAKQDEKPTATEMRVPPVSDSNSSNKPQAAPARAASPTLAAGPAAPAMAPAAARAGAVAPAAAADAEALRRQNEEKLLRAAEEEQKRAAALEAYEREQAELRKQAEREKQEREALRAKAAREAECQFKPVMTDDDIAKCRDAYK